MTSVCICSANNKFTHKSWCKRSLENCAAAILGKSESVSRWTGPGKEIRDTDIDANTERDADSDTWTLTWTRTGTWTGTWAGTGT